MPAQTATLTEAEQLECRESYGFHLETCVSVRNELQVEEWGVVPNVLQTRLEDALRWCKEQKKPARIIVLKGRRSGSSTMCAKVVDLECRNQTTRALQIADIYKRTDEIFGMVKHFTESDIFPWGFGAVATGAKIVYGNKSEVEKATAGDTKAGRGGQRRVIHASEVAHFQTGGVLDGGRMLIGLLPSVAKLPGTIVIAESTPNGQSGWFYDTWKQAQWPECHDYWQQWGAGNSATEDSFGNLWIRVFAAWFEIPTYRLHDVSADDKGRIERTLSPREKYGIKRYGWTVEQIAWRRTTIQTDCRNDERIFDQEFPEDPESCFLASGSACFTREALDRMQLDVDAATPCWRYGVLETTGDTAEDGVTFRETPVEGAWMKVIEEPRVGCYYNIPCDTMTGVDQSDAGNDPDAHSVGVLRRGYVDSASNVQHPVRLVARVIPPCRCSAKTLVYMSELLSRWYGGALFVPEVNKGLHVVERAKDKPLLPMYVRKTIDRIKDKITELLGWETMEDNRRQIVETLQEMVHATDPVQLVIECPHVLQEMRTFVKNKNGKFEAAPGCKDDDVMMLGIGLQTRSSANKMREKKRRRRRARNDYAN